MSNPINILIAEDEEHIAKLVAFKLGKEGYAVTVARNGEEAVDLLGAQPWKLLILDLMMPILDGLSVARIAREHPMTASVPVLLLTAKPQPLDVVAPAAVHYLKKPFDPAQLADTVRGILAGGGAH